MTQSIAAIIPARGGSKGIHKKNLCRIGGVPLIARAVITALASNRVDRVFVATDCDGLGPIFRAGIGAAARGRVVAGGTGTIRRADYGRGPAGVGEGELNTVGADGDRGGIYPGIGTAGGFPGDIGCTV